MAGAEPETGQVLERSPIAAALIERYADPLLLAPDDVARFAQPFARDLQRETVGKPQRAAHFQCRPRRGNITDRAGNSRLAELDCSGFQYAATRGNPVFVHHSMRGGI
jgi:hypothetical protein